MPSTPREGWNELRWERWKRPRWWRIVLCGELQQARAARSACVSRETAEVFGAWWCVDVIDSADLSLLYGAQSNDSNYEGYGLWKKWFISQGHENSFSCKDWQENVHTLMETPTHLYKLFGDSGIWQNRRCSGKNCSQIISWSYHMFNPPHHESVMPAVLFVHALVQHYNNSINTTFNLNPLSEIFPRRCLGLCALWPLVSALKWGNRDICFVCLFLSINKSKNKKVLINKWLIFTKQTSPDMPTFLTSTVLTPLISLLSHHYSELSRVTGQPQHTHLPTSSISARFVSCHLSLGRSCPHR